MTPEEITEAARTIARLHNVILFHEPTAVRPWRVVLFANDPPLDFCRVTVEHSEPKDVLANVALACLCRLFAGDGPRRPAYLMACAACERVMLVELLPVLFRGEDETAEWLVERFLPQTGVDWRPEEFIPEDYYAW